jgi:streptomycin 6-kinase
MTDNDRLNHYLTTWNLANPALLTETRTSQLYTVDYQGETVIFKLLAPSEIDEQRGALALRYFDGRGAVKLLRSDDSAHLLEYASGDELVTLCERGEDEAATRIIANVLQQLHSRTEKIPEEGLIPLERWFDGLFDKAAADRAAGSESLYMRGAQVAERLLAEPRDVRVLHGDIHHRNIRQSSRGWLAFDPKGLIGERTYDCANTLCNPVMPELVHNETRLLTNAGILAEALGLEQRRILEFTYAYTCLNASSLMRIGLADIVAWFVKVAGIIEPHIDVS